MAAMMSKMKSGPAPQPMPIETNPILEYFELGKESSSAGHCLIWRVHDAFRKSDGKECSLFFFDKRIADKLYKPKKKESMLDRIKACIIMLDKMRHPRMLQIIHSLEESNHTLAFASECVLGSLHNILAWHEANSPSAEGPVIQSDSNGAPPRKNVQSTQSAQNTQQAQSSQHSRGAQNTQPPRVAQNMPTPRGAQNMPTPRGAQNTQPPRGAPNTKTAPNTQNIQEPQTTQKTQVVQRPPFAREYHFIDIELRFGLLQIIEALYFMHYNIRQIHRNICPEIIIITKRGTWKLFGLEFAEIILGLDPTEMIAVPPWSIKVARLCQPNLDFLAPEVQLSGHCNILSDMFSLGLIICSLFNNGRSLLQSNNNPMLYTRQIEALDQQVSAVMPRIPPGLQEAVQRLLSRDPHSRPSTQLLPLINYFKCQTEPAIQAMQFLDVITSKDFAQKSHFYRGPLIEALPFIPKKLRWQLVWPCIKAEVKTSETLYSVLLPIVWLTNDASQEEFYTYILPALQNVDFMELMESVKTMNIIITLLENLHVLMRKCTEDDVDREIMPLLYAAMDNENSQIQAASLIALRNSADQLPNNILHNVILARLTIMHEQNQCDVKIVNLILGFYEIILLRLERNHVLESVIPTLLSMRLNDPDIITRVVRLYKSMLLEKKFGLTTNLMATKMIPSLAPQTINPALNLDQFGNLMEIMYDMMENIDKHQRSKLKESAVPAPSPERRSVLRTQTSTDNMATPAPPFNIPNLRVEKRKTSSAENMARKNSTAAPITTTAASSAAASAAGSASGSTTGIGAFRNTGLGQWFFGSSNSTNNDSNFLRVASVFPNRRLSDNTLMTPKIRIAPSCASSPGGTPGGTSGLPTRRHSSIGPQERRGSAVNLSPPTVSHQYRGRGGSGSSLSVPSTSRYVGGSMPNTSSSVPFLLTSSMQSIRSRRPSACISGSQGSGILQQISSGMVRHLPVGSHGNVPHAQQPWGALQGATSAGYNALRHTAMAVRKCPSLNITLTR